MSDRCREAQQVGILYLKDIDWQFRLYVMRGDPAETVDMGAMRASLAKQVRAMVAGHLSDEFDYVRSGFILAHYGRRGVTHSIWHWADWGGTWEYFCQAWYCYGRTLDQMIALDRSEPILCQHEIELVMQEAQAFKGITQRYSTKREVIYHYRKEALLAAQECGI